MKRSETALEMAIRLHGADSEIVKTLRSALDLEGATPLERATQLFGKDSAIVKVLSEAVKKSPSPKPRTPRM